jgi:hypothetical protein
MNYTVNYEGPREMKFSKGLDILIACRRKTGIVNLPAKCIRYNNWAYIDAELVVPEILLQEPHNFPKYCLKDFDLSVKTDADTLQHFFKLDIHIVWDTECENRIDCVVARWKFDSEAFLIEWVNDGCQEEWYPHQVCDADVL